MRRVFAYVTGIIACAFLLNIHIASAQAQKGLVGYYTSDDGGAYFIKQIGDKVYWFGEDPQGAYANVLVGTVSGNKITARWWDVPKGRAKGLGEITLEVQGGGATLVKLSSSAPFGAKTFKKSVVSTQMVNGLPVLTGLPPEMRSRPAGFSGGEQNLTGAWQGDDAATYYVREAPGGDIVWVAENNLWGGPGGYAQPSFTHVFVGKRINQLIIGDWVDVPKGKAAGNNSLALRVVSQQELKPNTTPVGISVTKLWRSLPNSLRGFADLHTHPMVNLALGGKFVHGGVDIGSLLPTDSKCNHKVRAKSIAQALGTDNSTHGGWGTDNTCGDDLRKAIIDAFQEQNKAVVTPDWAGGYPAFKDWPKWNDLTHQKMWVDWVRRAYDGGQRVMVALAMNNQTLAAGVSGPGDGPTDDKASADLQIAEIKAFVKRHDDFMEVAYSAADLRRIVAANKMAIVLGMETDNIGGFDKAASVTAAMVEAELDRLHKQGIRYIFPVHLIDNKFGGTAIYKNIFNLSNYHVNGKWWDVECATPTDGIKHLFKVDGFDFALAGAKALKLQIDIARNPQDPPVCTSSGHKNKRGLTALGKTAILEMMKRGMLIDVDHMSQHAVESALQLAESVPNGGYPVASGHNNFRDINPNENSRTVRQLERIGKLGGMFGLGSDEVGAEKFLQTYIRATRVVGAGKVSFGSDLNGLVKGPPPRAAAKIYDAAFTMSKTGDKKWDYSRDGVAHYGMLTDFLRDMSLMGAQGADLHTQIMKNAEAFAQMWEKAEKQSKGVLP